VVHKLNRLPLIYGFIWRWLKPAGQPYPHALVRVKAGGRCYSTRADAQGRWAFHTPEIGAGEVTFVLGKMRKTVAYGGGTMPVLNCARRSSFWQS
jgi:hypothetical protein